MKKLFILLLILSFQLSSGQTTAELSVYISAAPDLNSQKAKIQTNFHYLNGYSNLGLIVEKFKLENIDATQVGVEFGYTFTNFVIPIEMTPIIGYGWFSYEKRAGRRFVFGYDFAYIINRSMKIHALINLSENNWTVINEEIDFGVVIGKNYGKRNNLSKVLLIGISFNL
jgi:hypothetical protein